MGKLRHAVSRPQGLVLITGPTGSGKTTTIYGLLKELVRGTRNIITLEDPVEYELAGVNQTQLDPMRGLTIQEFRKGYVRQDPDVLFLGEIRDYDTASFALEASLTGHLVISTLHTESAAGAIYRLISLGVHAEILSQSLLLLQAQRLVRKLCPVCKRAQLLTEIVDRKRWQDYFLRAKMSVPDRLFCPVGCPRCQHTGYLGRAVLTEMIPVCKLMAQAIAVARVDNLFKIRETAAAIGIKTLFEDALRLLSQGVIPIQEAELYGDPWENYEQGNSQTTNPV
jgi:type II secretory ATPase GspE/PulE/Tfp pilus assembly ATPase PilB-like protein